MPYIHSIAPISPPAARLLILGSMPGKVSLLAGQYYAHPQNGFWKIICSLFESQTEGSYADKIGVLHAHGIALWDVLKSCTRETSLDSDIVESSIITNDFRPLFRAHPQIDRIYFNGVKAEQLFRKYVLPDLDPGNGLQLYKLPSTSPANAALSFREKLDAWSVICADN